MRRRVLSTLVVTAALTSAVALTVRDSWADPVPSASSSAVATPAPVADTSLPAGWRIDGNGGATLTWRSDQDIPVGDAFIEFRSGEHLLGIAEEGDDLRTFRLRLTAGGSLTDLQVWAAGRRLDRGAPAAAQRSSSSLSQPARGTGDGAAAVPVNAVDPGVKGPYATRSGEYSLPDVALRGLRNKVEVRAAVVGPVGAPGRRPVVVLLHGRHFTCYQGTDPASARLDWPCPPGDQEVPSYRGFAQAQELLASQGYLTVSISANGISEQDRQTLDGGAAVRSALIRLHLGKLADWSGSQRSQAPAIIRRLPLADLSKVLLVGHSRGGDGANTAAIDTVNPPPAAVDAYPGKVRWQVRGTVLIGPTSTGQNPAPDVPSLILLPGCDGDVSDLEGQMFADASRGVSTGAALHSAVFMTGANHNFFNSQWTPGLAQAPAFDDASSTDDAVCGTGPTSTRITATQQRAAGATYLAAAARLFIGGDDRVRPLLDGSGTRAPSAGPNPFPTAAVGGARTPFVLPALSLKVTGKAVLCEQTGADEAKACLDQTSVGGSPHFTNLGYAGAGDEPDRYSVRLTASKDGSAAALRPAKPVSLAGSTDLALRIAAPPNSSGNVVAVSVVDKAGKRAKLGEVRLDGLPGTALTSSYWGQERRVSLAAARTAGVDLTAVAGLELVVRGTAGPLFLIDGWGWRTGLPAPQTRPLTRVDLGSLTVAEGDSGSRTVAFPVTVTGRGSGTINLFGDDHDGVRKLAVRPGTASIGVSKKVVGDKLYGMAEYLREIAKPVRGVVIGHVGGEIVVNDDDPQPKVTVVPIAGKVVEGKPLTYRVTLSTKAETAIYTYAIVQPPAAGHELSTIDVDPAWIAEHTESGQALPDRPLSDPTSETRLYTAVEPGKLTADLTVPTVTDDRVEGTENFEAKLFVIPRGGLTDTSGPVFTGTVSDPA